MGARILRQGSEGDLDDMGRHFSDIGDAIDWMVSNTWHFLPNEIVAVIHLNRGMCRFVKFEATVAVKVLEE
jgi:hypothetical protein